MVNRSRALPATLLLSATLLSSCSPAYANSGSEDDFNYSRTQVECPAPASEAGSTDGRDDSAPTSSSDVQSAAAWKQEGSEAHTNAKATFDYLTGEVGFSGGFAVGLIANGWYESGWILDRSQGAGVIRFGMNSKTPPANEGGGGGAFQFTPYTKFTNSEYWGKYDPEGWGLKNQLAYMLDTEFKTGAVATYAFSTSPAAGAAHYGRSPAFSSLEEWYSTDDASKAAEAFQVGYERPAQFHPERLALAAEMNDFFNAERIPADKEKIAKFMGGSINGSSDEFADVSFSDSAAPSSSDSSGSEGECPSVHKAKGGGGSIPEDATGDHGLGDLGAGWGRPFQHDQLPEELKKYAIDPESLGINFGDCKNWVPFTNTTEPLLNGQCVALSKAVYGTYWQKDGKSPASFLCNGEVCAEAASTANGGSPERTPRAGAIAQQKKPGPYGHTYIVSHVFENGDILILEQNMDGYSGWQNGQVCNWNWRVQSKAGYESFDSMFYTPTNEGFSVSDKAKTLG